VVGLALSGLGWYFEDRPKPPPVKKVFCDIQSLEHLHPAWSQVKQVDALTRESTPDRGLEAIDFPRTASIAPLPEPVTSTESREALKVRLEEKAQWEFDRINAQLSEALDRRLKERRQELEAEAAASEAEARRSSEQELAQSLRALSEEHKYDRVDAAIKLAALKAQLTATGIEPEKVQSAIKARELALEAVRSKLAQDENELRMNLDSSLAEAKQRHTEAIQEELDSIKSQEENRIASIISGRCDRFNEELSDYCVPYAAITPKEAIRSFTDDAGAKHRVVKTPSTAAFGLTVVAADEKGEQKAFSKALRDRIRAELRSVVNRIAREHGMEVTFQPSPDADDKTDWFRSRLPYITNQDRG